MKNGWMLLMILLLQLAAMAADDPHAGHDMHNSSAGRQEAQIRPENTETRIPENDLYRGGENSDIPPVHDNEIFATFIADRVEYRTGDGENDLLWDFQAWIGSDYRRLYLESEGEWLVEPDEAEEALLELLYGFNISVYWDLRFGVRHDFKPGPERTFGAFGLQGLAPYWFEAEATAYISEDGDISAEIEAEYDLLLSQKLILQPRLETGLALQEVEEHGVGRGFTDLELGLRLRYEIRREFAPYIGVSWSRQLGETADLAREEGEEAAVTRFVAGVRFWF